jgi:hypothetical protein
MVMKLELQFTKSGRKFKLWQLLFVIGVIGAGLALLPERIGGPLFLVIEGSAVVALLFLLVVVMFRKLAGK